MVKKFARSHEVIVPDRPIVRKVEMDTLCSHLIRMKRRMRSIVTGTTLIRSISMSNWNDYREPTLAT